MKIIGSQKEIDFIEDLIRKQQEGFECDDCPVFEQCESTDRATLEGLGTCGNVVWNFIETKIEY